MMSQTKLTVLIYVKNRINYIYWCGPGSSVGIATGYADRIPVGARFSAPVQTGPGAHLASCAMGTGSFPGVNSGRGMTLTPHPLLVPWSWKGRAIPLLPQRAVRPVQSISACTRVHFTFIAYVLIYVQFQKIPGKERVRELVFTEIFYSVVEISVQHKHWPSAWFQSHICWSRDLSFRSVAYIRLVLIQLLVSVYLRRKQKGELRRIQLWNII
jgi:hypothetical protein